jgi:predicted DNA-binding protein
MHATILTIRMAPQKLAKLDRRAAELGRDRSGYVRSLIEEDLKSQPRAGKYVFASKDLVGSVSTGIKEGNNATVRKVVRARLLARYAKNR